MTTSDFRLDCIEASRCTAYSNFRVLNFTVPVQLRPYTEPRLEKESRKCEFNILTELHSEVSILNVTLDVLILVVTVMNTCPAFSFVLAPPWDLWRLG
jgi:hypothetical protein